MTRHIVTTDDDAAIRKVLQIMLKKEGFQVSTCKSGEELINFMHTTTSSVDLILLDIKMPGMSGLEALQSLQHDYPEVPVVMLTAFNDLDTGMNAIRGGAADYLAKPVGKDALISCVDRVLAKTLKRQQDDKLRTQAITRQKELERQLQEVMATLNNTTRTTLEAFSETLQQKDYYTKGHCNRVLAISMAIGQALRFPPQRMAIIEGGALLHDIGKIGIAEEVLNKETPLTDEEEVMVKAHPVAGERIVAPIEMFQAYRPIIRNHHERFDGTGYPDGLKGEEIPLEVRIVSLADAFDAMTTDRAYRPALSVEIAIEEIKACSGTQFDPALVDLFIDKELYLL